jgi:hypothetical protein
MSLVPNLWGAKHWGATGLLHKALTLLQASRKVTISQQAFPLQPAFVSMSYNMFITTTTATTTTTSSSSSSSSESIYSCPEIIGVFCQLFSQ